jgi:hypothetical protein
LREILTYSLGPIPWSLATADGSFVKTVKSKLLDAIENDVEDYYSTTGVFEFGNIR